VSVSIPAPMLASAGGRPFTDPEWLYEIKFDGYRTLARFGDGEVELRTKNGANCTAWYPEVVQALAQIPGGPFVVDGEACVLDELGRSDFNRLQDRARRRRSYPGCDQVTFCVTCSSTPVETSWACP
jgi:bifunctional non-homologous end joining protein LigD